MVLCALIFSARKIFSVWQAVNNAGDGGLDSSTQANSRVAILSAILKMSIARCVFLIAFCGGIGGIVACFHKEAIFWPKLDRVKRIWKPGAIGNIIVGAVAAALVWILYGPASSYDLAGDSIQRVALPLSQIGTSVLIGFSGGRVLTSIAQKQADHVTRDELAKTLKDILENSSRK